MKSKFSLLLCCAAAACAAGPSEPLVPDMVKDRYAAPAESTFEGPIGARLKVNRERRLLEGVDLDVLVAGYRKRPGVQTWIGEHIGKFLDAAMADWAYSKDDRLRAKAELGVRGLLPTQLPDGYLGTYLEPDRWVDWDLWAHKYNLIGLLHYYQRTGDRAALDACRKMGDLVVRTYGPGLRDIVLRDKHVGMANTSILEPMVSLYRYTGEKKYLDFCRYIVDAWNGPQGPRIIATLLETGSVRRVANAKAYEMMSNLVGLLELYRLTGDAAYLKPVEIAWRDIREKRLYPTGTASWRERFQDDGLLRATDGPLGGVGEGCVTTTWMQMNLHLLRLTGEARYAEELERTTYNALFGSQHPAKGTICYFTPLDGPKPYGAVSHGVAGVSCCTSSIPRGLTLVPGIAWGRRESGIAVNLYTAGRAAILLNGQTVTLNSRTSYPEAGTVELEMGVTAPSRFVLYLRVPAWTRRFTATAAGRPYEGKPGDYLAIDRTWKNGDRVAIDMDMTVRVHPGAPTYPGYVALQRGPQVLALEVVTHDDSPLFLAGLTSPELRVPVDHKFPRGWAGSQVYECDGFTGNAALGRKPRKLTLVPFADAGQLGHEVRVWLQEPPGRQQP